MRSGERHQPVQALSPQGSDHTVADGIHLLAVRCGSAYVDPERVSRLIELAREYTVAAIEKELMPVITANYLA